MAEAFRGGDIDKEHFTHSRTTSDTDIPMLDMDVLGRIDPDIVMMDVSPYAPEENVSVHTDKDMMDLDMDDGDMMGLDVDDGDVMDLDVEDGNMMDLDIVDAAMEDVGTNLEIATIGGVMTMLREIRQRAESIEDALKGAYHSRWSGMVVGIPANSSSRSQRRHRKHKRANAQGGAGAVRWSPLNDTSKMALRT